MQNNIEAAIEKVVNVRTETQYALQKLEMEHALQQQREMQRATQHATQHATHDAASSSSQEIVTIDRVKEIEKMEQNKVCMRCKTNPLGSIFLPCKHVVTCLTCSDAVHYCTFCNVEILGTVKTFVQFNTEDVIDAEVRKELAKQGYKVET